jgi:hypothetical protein
VNKLGLLPKYFRKSDSTVYVRSTQYDRTIASAEALLTGLYPPSFRAWSDEGQFSIDIRHESSKILDSERFCVSQRLFF